MADAMVATGPAADGARPDASSVTSAAELVAAMRALKCWSGRSYRQLESLATRNGMVLPRSTLMNALSRESLPREDLVAAFVRACGCGEDETARWVLARRRLAVAAVNERVAHAGPGAPGAPVRRHRRRLRRIVLMLLTLAGVLAAGVYALTTG